MAVIAAWRSGEVEVIPRAVDGALILARGPKRRLEVALFSIARYAYNDKTLLVPGVPEADSDDEALDAVFRFQNLLERRLVRRERKGVTR